MRIVHYKSVAVKLVIHAAAAKSGGFRRHADFHTLYNAAGGRLVRVGDWFVTGHSSNPSVVMGVFGPKFEPVGTAGRVRDSTPRRRWHGRFAPNSNFSVIPA
jgi:hypothetical protein